MHCSLFERRDVRTRHYARFLCVFGPDEKRYDVNKIIHIVLLDPILTVPDVTDVIIRGFENKIITFSGAARSSEPEAVAGGGFFFSFRLLKTRSCFHPRGVGHDVMYTIALRTPRYRCRSLIPLRHRTCTPPTARPSMALEKIPDGLTRRRRSEKKKTIKFKTRRFPGPNYTRLSLEHDGNP